MKYATNFLIGLALLFVSGSALVAGVLRPRVPEAELTAARALKNPIARTSTVIARGREIYNGKGFCVACHGRDGRGISGVDPTLLKGALPTDFTDKEWQTARADGEVMWVLKHGSSGTAMASFVPSVLTEEEGWTPIHYLRTLVTP
ncbi:MAG: c-type cytochrome [Chromatiales bacterium]